LDRHLEEVLHPLVTEVTEALAWAEIVKRTFTSKFLERYQHDYLYGQRYGEFNQALVRLLTLLEVPGIGEAMKLLTNIVRTPFRFVSALLGLSHSSEGAAPGQSAEWEVLTKGVAHWLAGLKAEAQTLAHTRLHPAWSMIVSRVESAEFSADLLHHFTQGYNSYRYEMQNEVQQRSQEIYDSIAQRPALLQALRGVNLAADAATIVLIVKSAGVDWSDAVLGPLIAGFRRVLLEAGLGSLLATQKRLLRQHQLAALQHLAWRTFVEPVCELFPAQAAMSTLESTRQDFALVKQAALRIARSKA